MNQSLDRQQQRVERSFLSLEHAFEVSAEGPNEQPDDGEQQPGLKNAGLVHANLKMENDVRDERKLILVPTVVVGRNVVGMVVTNLGTNGDEFVRPPGDTNGMFRIWRGKTRARAYSIVEIFIAYSEERIARDAKHRVVHNRPFRGIAVSHGEGATLERNVLCGMTDRVVFPHIPGLGRSVDLVIKLVRPRADELLHVVVAPFAIINHVVAKV